MWRVYGKDKSPITPQSSLRKKLGQVKTNNRNFSYPMPFLRYSADILSAMSKDYSLAQ
jgi:hypothetical protein